MFTQKQVENLMKKEHHAAMFHGELQEGFNALKGMKNAKAEVAHVDKFDFVIINELFDRALFDLKAIVHSQRLKYTAQRRARAETFRALLIP